MFEYRVFDTLKKEYLERARKFDFYLHSDGELCVSSGYNSYKEPTYEDDTDQSRYIVEFNSGIKDENRVEFFVGDRIKGWKNDPGKIFTVAYLASKYACEFVATDNDQCNPHVKLWYEGFEVIGNIHDK